MICKGKLVFVDDFLDPVLVGRHPRVDAGEAVPRAANAPRSDANLTALGVAHEQGTAAVALMRHSYIVRNIVIYQNCIHTIRA